MVDFLQRGIDIKRDQAFKFWDALDNNTSLKVVLSAFENKTGYGGRRTLQRYAQAHEGFKEDLTSDVVAKKTGWHLKYVEKLRSWWKQKYRKKVRDDQKPGEEVSSRKREEARHRQKLTWKSPPEQRAAERGRMVRLIDAWLEELVTFSPVHLLKARLDTACEDALSSYYTDKDVEAAYVEARKCHLSETGPLLQVQVDPAYMLLRLRHPRSRLWPAFESWQEQEAPYANAFDRMMHEIESVADEATDWAFSKYVKGAFRNIVWVEGDELSTLVKRFAFRRWLAVLALCDLLVVGIAELPSARYWVDLIDDLKDLRLKANVELSAVTGFKAQRVWSRGVIGVLAQSPDTQLELTAEFLDELAELRLRETRLVTALRQLKSKLEFRV